jgi:hypothetical protein
VYNQKSDVVCIRALALLGSVALQRGDRITSHFGTVQLVCLWHKADMAIALSGVVDFTILALA